MRIRPEQLGAGAQRHVFSGLLVAGMAISCSARLLPIDDAGAPSSVMTGSGGAAGSTATTGSGGITGDGAAFDGGILTAGSGGSPSSPGNPLPNGNCPLVPPTDPGNPTTGCSIVGTWFLNSSHGSVHSTGVIQFRADGAYYGAASGVDLTQTYAYDGEYAVSGSMFNLIFSCGDGTCIGSGSFAMQFQSDCALATLTEQVTECTGNRTAVAGDVILTRQN